ncbi:hypothetical protein GCM10027168_71670 [Streptomyces capparidis]
MALPITADRRTGPTPDTAHGPSASSPAVSLGADAVRVDRHLLSGVVHFPFRARSGAGTWAELGRLAADLGAERHLLVVDDLLPPEHAARVLAHLTAAAPTRVLRLPARPPQPGPWPPWDLPGSARPEAVVSLGGTRAVDAARLLAAHAGARPVHLPTTLWTAAGAALALRHPDGGPVPPPALVWTHTDLLATQPRDAVRSGVAQVVRAVLAAAPARYDDMAATLRPDARYGPRALAAFLGLTADVRAALTAFDPLEEGLGAALRYGDTVGRAARSAAGGTLRHGFATGLGMLAAARIAVRRGLMDTADERAHRLLLERAGAPAVWPRELDPERVAALAASGADGADVALLDGLGRPHRERGRMATRVARDELRAAIESLLPPRHPAPGPGPLSRQPVPAGPGRP